MEKIVSIVECSFKIDEDKWATTFEGYKIVTSKQEIKMGISEGQSCCERTGYFMSEDNIQDFIDAKLIEVRLTDDCLNPVKWEEVDFYEGGTMFVDLVTDRGVLQFVAYNSHNGYYGHDAVVKSTQLDHETTL